MRLVSQMQQAEMATLLETDHRHQAQMVETLHVMRDMRREMSDMQAELLAHREQQRRARQPGPDARIPNHQDASGDADSENKETRNRLGPKGQKGQRCQHTLNVPKLIPYYNSAPRRKEESDNKRKADDSSTNQHGHQQQPFRGKCVAKVYNIRGLVRRSRIGSLPSAQVSNFPSQGPVVHRDATSANKVEHLPDDCQESSPQHKFANTQKGQCTNPKGNGGVYAVGNRIEKRECIRKHAELQFRHAQEYMAKGCQIFLAHISAKKEEDKLEGKQLKDVPINQDFPEVFLEDLSETRKEHEERLKAIQIASEGESCMPSFSKKNLEIPKVQFFTSIINSKGIHVDPAKIESIKDWASPKTPTEICQFLGIKFDWGEKEENAFQLIKQKLCSAPILALPEGSEDFVVYCDASHKGLGTVLMQREKKALGTDISMSTAYHPETDGQSERTIQTLEDMLRACVIDFGKGWVKHLPLAKFSYNNSYHASIKAAPYEALYGRKCRSPVCWAEVGEAQLTGPELIQETTEKIVLIKQRIQAAQDR
ncbi:putative reverse transcriptase domain-containing protein [Tanacetum coccineum]|uniref:Reverse transcriptase domain-containing protein n=1 Tax=Tanacetum coccineum TaxID=301880 RepID=A0ABQ5AVZ7_9ASTR